MRITDVKVFPVEEDKLKAYATITFDNCFIIRDLKVISGNKGFFIAMPSKKRKDGTFRDVAHPLNSETRKMIEDAVLEEYNKTAAEGAKPVPYPEGADEEEAAQAAAQEDAPPPAQEPAPVQAPAEAPEPAREQTATDNPAVQGEADPEKAFGYKE